MLLPQSSSAPPALSVDDVAFLDTSHVIITEMAFEKVTQWMTSPEMRQALLSRHRSQQRSQAGGARRRAVVPHHVISRIGRIGVGARRICRYFLLQCVVAVIGFSLIVSAKCSSSRARTR